MDHQELFSLVYQSLNQTYSQYLNHIVKSLGFVLLALGWILTSTESRDYLSGNKTALIAALIVIAIMAVVHTRVCISLYLTSKNKKNLLCELDYINEKYFVNYSITIAQLIFNLLMILSILFVLFLLVYFSGSSPS